MKSHDDAAYVLAKALLCLLVIAASSGCGGGGQSPGGPPSPQLTRVSLPATGQVTSYDSNTSQRDDGALETGVAWPVPRFTAASAGTGSVVTDDLTGLMWAGDAATPTFVGATTCVGGTKTWDGARAYVACLNVNAYLGYSDWRLPNRKELWSLIHKGAAGSVGWLGAAGFSGLLGTTFHWSSTSSAGTTARAWRVSAYDEQLDHEVKTAALYVWPVRAGGTGPAALGKTGQRRCYDSADPANEISCTGSGQDGELRTGVAWPGTRFAVISGGAGNVVVDNLTGLMWPQDAGAPTIGACAGGVKAWQDALSYVACLNSGGYLGHNDWRLPNVNELESLFHAGYNEEACGGSPCATNAAWLGAQGFSNVAAASYWSSTTYAEFIGYAWMVSMAEGRVYEHYKSTVNNVLPVRDAP